MASIAHFFWAPLQETFFLKALIGGSMVAVVSGVVGCLVVLRKMSFLGDALSHAMIAGVAGGYLFMKLLFGIEAYAPAMLIGSLIAAILTVMLIGFVSRMSRVKEDTAIGIMYTGIFAGGVVMVSIFRDYIHIDLMHFIMGDVLAVADADLWASAVSSALVLTVLLLFFRHFQLTSFDPVMAAAIGMPVVLIDYALTTCVSLVVVSAVSMVGVILVVGLLITPAATAYLLSDRLDRMMLLAAFFGVTSVIGGLYLCVWADSSGGGAIMLFCTFQFLAILIVAPRYGLLARWLRVYRIVPQQLVEDILVTIIRQDSITLDEIKARLNQRGAIARAVRTLTGQGYLKMLNNDIFLTDTGRVEANRILRAHRLWEAYLRHVGTPESEIHRQAESLEHMHDSGTVEYIDDLLGHPVQDPHGQEIPEDDTCMLPGNVVPISYFRKGREGIIATVPPQVAFTGLKPGEKFQMGRRQDQGRSWIVVVEGGMKVVLDHETADIIMARCV